MQSISTCNRHYSLFWKFERVCSLVGSFIYNMYIVNKFQIVFIFNVKDKIYLHVYIILDIHITYRNASVLCQTEWPCLHKTANNVVFFVKSNENLYPKGRALMQMYRVVPLNY